MGRLNTSANETKNRITFGEMCTTVRMLFSHLVFGHILRLVDQGPVLSHQGDGERAEGAADSNKNCIFLTHFLCGNYCRTCFL